MRPLILVGFSLSIFVFGCSSDALRSDEDMSVTADLAPPPVDIAISADSHFAADMTTPADMTPPPAPPADLLSADISPPSDMAPFLSVVSLGSPTQIDFTAEGTLDWIHSGHLSASAINEKAGASELGPLMSTGTLDHSSLGSREITWSDGAPLASATTDDSLYTDGSFTITARASSTLRELRLYLRGFETTTRLAVSLPGRPDIVLNGLFDHGFGEALYRVQYLSWTPGDVVTVRWSPQVSGTGFVSFVGATLH